VSYRVIITPAANPSNNIDGKIETDVDAAAVPVQNQTVLFWRWAYDYGASIWGFGNWELVDSEGKAYAVLATTLSKSMKMGRLHALRGEAEEGFVDLIAGGCMVLWNKGEKDIWKNAGGFTGSAGAASGSGFAAVTAAATATC